MPSKEGNHTHQASLYADTPAVAIQISRGVMVASIQVDLVETVLSRFREDLLQRVHQTGCRGVILDLSGLETLDNEEFASLRSIMAMVKVMGTESVLVGLRPGVVSALIETGADVDGLRSALDLDAAFALFEPTYEAEVAVENDTDADTETQEESVTESWWAPLERQ